MKKYLLVLACAMPLAAYAADNPDKSFYKSAAEAGLAEVDDATLAQSSATDPKLKDFAAMMIKDHTAANEKLETLAGSKDIKLPKGPSVTEKAEHAKLKVLTGDTFDKSYIKGQVSAHRATIRLLHKEISTGQDPDAQAFAKSVLPTIEGHLKAIETLASNDGVKVK